MVCPDMKKITLENLLDCLETLSGRITVAEDIRKKALGAVQRMVEL
jgi:quinolinate synthase